MSGPVLAKIYLGKITKWNDPAIAKLNPGKNLPSTKITVVHRSDGSGTTYNFTDYLSHVSATWKSQVGTGTAVNWPTGDRRAAQLRRRRRRQADARRNRLRGDVVSGPQPPDVLQDAEPVRQVRPAEADGRARGGSARHASREGRLALDRQSAEVKKYRNAYPISTYTYIIVAKRASKAAALKQPDRLGDHEGSEVRAEAVLRAASRRL